MERPLACQGSFFQSAFRTLLLIRVDLFLLERMVLGFVAIG